MSKGVSANASDARGTAGSAATAVHGNAPSPKPGNHNSLRLGFACQSNPPPKMRDMCSGTPSAGPRRPAVPAYTSITRSEYCYHVKTGQEVSR